MSLNDLNSWCDKLGESKYRGRQLFEWIYRHGIYMN